MRFSPATALRNASIGLTGFALANSAFAIDTTEVVTAIKGAETDGMTVAQGVIAVVAAFVVVGVIIGLVRKI